MRILFRYISKVLPTPLIQRGIGNLVVSPFYHLVSDTPPSHAKYLYRVLSTNEFERDLDYFLKRYIPIDANTLVNFVNNEVELSKPPLFLSFDDGFREVKDTITPILLRKGIPATFFVNPAYVGNSDMMYRCKISLIIEHIKTSNATTSVFFEIAKILKVKNNHSVLQKVLQLNHNQVDVLNAIAERIGLDFNQYLLESKPYLSLAELQMLAKLGFTIGGHGYNHPYFNQIPFDEQFSEVMNCMKWISSNFPNQPKLFAYPFTDFGVSGDLIKKVLFDQPSSCDLSFGTAGIQPNRFQKHSQRISMEEHSASGQSIVNGEILYYIAKTSIGHYRRNHD